MLTSNKKKSIYIKKAVKTVSNNIEVNIEKFCLPENNYIQYTVKKCILSIKVFLSSNIHRNNIESKSGKII